MSDYIRGPAFLETTNTNRQIQIDSEDFERVSKHVWYEDQDGYARTNIVTVTQILTERGLGEHRSIQNVKLHQFVRPNVRGWSFADGNKLNCCKDNLIEFKNTGPRRGSAKHGKGVLKKNGRFYAYHYDRVSKVKKYLGSFPTAHEANVAIDVARLATEHNLELMRLNNVDRTI